MSRNERSRDAEWLSLPVPSGVKSGEPVQVGDLVGVAATDEGDGGNPAGVASVHLGGAYDLEVTGAVAAVGSLVYIAADRSLTTTAAGNWPFGFALETKGTGAGVVTVKVSQNPRRWSA